MKTYDIENKIWASDVAAYMRAVDALSWASVPEFIERLTKRINDICDRYPQANLKRPAPTGGDNG